MSSLYVHIPFCRSKCLYCDFYSLNQGYAGRLTSLADRVTDVYCASLAEELILRSDEIAAPVTTLYFGGGTPSSLPPLLFEKTARSLRKILGERDAIEEFTIEVNPEDVDIDRISAWENSGVNRVSIGVQTFSDELLRRIGRRHTAQQALSAIEGIRKTIPNISIDLIYGLPAQSIDDWASSLSQAMGLQLPHLSAYTLMLEPGSAFYKLAQAGKFPQIDDELIEEMYVCLCRMTEQAGMNHYEISNFALDGFESLHNNSYWYGVPYIGLGAAAHSYDGVATRRGNHPDLKGYIDAVSEKSLPPAFTEHLSMTELREEMILTRMRTSKGLSVQAYRDRFGDDKACNLLEKAKIQHRKGLLDFKDDYIVLSPKGVMLADSVILELASFDN